MLTILKGLPLSYFKDLQDDKEILFKSYDNLNNCLKIFDEILKNFSPNKKKMLELANSGYTTATDLADYLVKNHSMSFRKAYQKTAAVVNYAEKKKKKLNELSIEELKKIEPKLKDDVLKVFNLKNSINSKKSYGGTSFDNIKKMIMKYKKRKMIKKIALIILLFCAVISCGKKGDPEYIDPNKKVMSQKILTSVS